jgi:hypothetical protein
MVWNLCNLYFKVALTWLKCLCILYSVIQTYALYFIDQYYMMARVYVVYLIHENLTKAHTLINSLWCYNYIMRKRTIANILIWCLLMLLCNTCIVSCCYVKSPIVRDLQKSISLLMSDYFVKQYFSRWIWQDVILFLTLTILRAYL